MLCSENFRPEDFDRTGQTVRIRAGAVPSVFCFPAHLHRPVVTRTSQTSKKAQETLSLDCSQRVQEAEPLPLPNGDHSYALPSSHDDLRARLREALARVESLEIERRNVKDRERRAKNTVSGLLQDLRVKNIDIARYILQAHQEMWQHRMRPCPCLLLRCPLLQQQKKLKSFHPLLLTFLL